MTAMPPLRDILNNTPADATDVDYNFKTIQSHIATELINRDGSVSMNSPINVPPPTAPNNAANKAYVDAHTPVGTIQMFAGGPGTTGTPTPPQTVPAGWALCNAAVKSQTDPNYAALYGVIGATYNRGDEGPGNFRLPDLQARFPVGKGTTAPFTALNAPGGSKDAILVAHSHTINDHTHGMKNHQHVVPQHGHSASSQQPTATAHAHGAVGGGTWGFFVRQPGTGTLQLTASAGSEQWAQQSFTMNADVPHTHPISVVDQVAFWTNQINDNTSEGASNRGTDAPGVSATDGRLPPYIVVNYIIRIGIP